MSQDNDALVIISSDGHAGALMADYRPYLDPDFRDEFDAFLVEWNEKGSRNFDPPSLKNRLDPEFVDEWIQKMVETERIDGFPDPLRRIKEMEREGVVAEVLFPDFGLPFELYSPSLASTLGYPPRDDAHMNAGMRAFNRWVLDFTSAAPERFRPMAYISWDDIDATKREIEWAASAGFVGIVLPGFDTTRPVFHPDYYPIWDLLNSLEMVVNTHPGMSSTDKAPVTFPGAPHPACGYRLMVPTLFFKCQSMLLHLVWGGIMERCPRVKFVFTELGSGWVPRMLTEMDYAYEGSYFRTDYKNVIPRRPSEYFQRQMFIGSSIFSKDEIRRRDEIGPSKMMMGMDFPHHEGTLLETTQEYLRASFGAAEVPTAEARRMLGETAAQVFSFDLGKLQPVARRIDAQPSHVLSKPDEDLFPRGDINRPA